MMPTKIEVSEPLIVFLRTSRPHLSPPKASVALRASAGAVSPVTPLPALMSAITSASGATDFSSAAGAPPGAVAGWPPFSSAMTSPIGSTIFDLYSAAGGSGTGAAPRAAGAPPPPWGRGSGALDCGAYERRRRIVGADLARPILRNQAGARQDHHHQEQRDNPQRHH